MSAGMGGSVQGPPAAAGHGFTVPEPEHRSVLPSISNPPEPPQNPGCGCRRLPQHPRAHALTLQAAVGAVQRHVAAVDDKIHLLQGERRGVSTGWGAPWGPFPTSSPTATLSRGPFGHAWGMEAR